MSPRLASAQLLLNQNIAQVAVLIPGRGDRHVQLIYYTPC